MGVFLILMLDEFTHLQATMRACRRCLEAGFAITPGAVFSGPVTARVMLIGQAPGATEVTARRPFNAGSGRRLFTWLAAAGWDEATFRAQYYMTAVTKCFPGKAANGRGDRAPGRPEQALCRPFLEQEAQLLQPWLIIPVGSLAMQLFFPGARLEDVIGRGLFIPLQAADATSPLDSSAGRIVDQWQKATPDEGRYIIPLPHPSGASAWPGYPPNAARLEQAIALLRAARLAWSL